MTKNPFWRGSIFFRFFHSDRPLYLFKENTKIYVHPSHNSCLIPELQNFIVSSFFAAFYSTFPLSACKVAQSQHPVCIIYSTIQFLIPSAEIGFINNNIQLNLQIIEIVQVWRLTGIISCSFSSWTRFWFHVTSCDQESFLGWANFPSQHVVGTSKCP